MMIYSARNVAKKVLCFHPCSTKCHAYVIYNCPHCWVISVLNLSSFRYDWSYENTAALVSETQVVLKSKPSNRCLLAVEPSMIRINVQFLFRFFGWGENEPIWYVGHYLTYCIFVGRLMMDTMEQSVKVNGRGYRSTYRKSDSLPLWSPQIPPYWIWDWMLAVELVSYWLTGPRGTNACPDLPVLGALHYFIAIPWACCDY